MTLPLYSNTSHLIASLAELTLDTDRHRIEKKLIQMLRSLCSAEAVSLGHIHYHKDQILLHITRCLCSPSFEAGDQSVFSEQTDMRLCDLPAHQRCYESQTVYIEDYEGIQHCVVPIKNRQGNITSLFECYTKKLDRERLTLIEHTLAIYAHFIAVIDESEKDALTDLLNRRTFERRMTLMLQPPDADTQREIEHRSDTPKKGRNQCWLAAIDIDHFKKVNDNYGHLYGDEVLIMVANFMRESFRYSDRLFRFGGEEFVVLLKQTDLAGAQRALERFRHSIEQHSFAQAGCVTVSIGFTEIHIGDIPSQILEHADDALYYAKEHGRNQVCFYEQLVELGHLQSHSLAQNHIELF